MVSDSGIMSVPPAAVMMVCCLVVSAVRSLNVHHSRTSTTTRPLPYTRVYAFFIKTSITTQSFQNRRSQVPLSCSGTLIWFCASPRSGRDELHQLKNIRSSWPVCYPLILAKVLTSLRLKVSVDATAFTNRCRNSGLLPRASLSLSAKSSTKGSMTLLWVIA